MNSLLSIETENGTMNIDDLTLIVALDETGCEDYKDTKYPVFGLGGCAVLARDYNRFLDAPWCYIKGTYFGGHDIKMHAAELRKPTHEQLEALENFFTTLPFFRFVTMSAHTFENHSDESNVHLLTTSILHQICNIVQIAQPKHIIYVVEHSQRLSPLVMRYLKSYKFGCQDYEIEPQVMYATKNENLSCLEVADFVVHPAGAQVRNRLMGNNRGTRKDFEIVFSKVDSRLSFYQEILSAQPHST
ncbi:hypothetical protein AKJ18_02465 [Vibrio xuii]|nr:hypothetical protein AKJ18_02465 [Vibrio xuii]